VEKSVKDYWSNNRIYEKIKAKALGAGRKFLLIDVSPYPSGGVPHIGTA
jgi:isoleucyl-tRNA synthetase